MTRTTISLPESLLRDLKRLAADEGVSMAELVREAVEQRLMAKRPQPRSFGMGASGHTDTSRLAGEQPAIPPPWR